MQRDAIDRLDLTRLLLEPEMLAALEPDVHLVGTLLEPCRPTCPTRPGPRRGAVVATVVEQIEARLARPRARPSTGALRRHLRTRRPRPGDIDWDRTIQRQPAPLPARAPHRRARAPHRLRTPSRRPSQRELVIAIDQSGSMAESVVYAGVFGSVLASVPALRTSVVAFDTAVVDLTAELHDPVDVLFGVQLGGGTDINRAVAYCQA